MKSWLDYKTYLSSDFKLMEERTKYRVYCKCGHSIVFFPVEHKDKKLCSWCGYYVYRNKKVEFIDRLNSLLKIEGVYQ